MDMAVGLKSSRDSTGTVTKYVTDVYIYIYDIFTNI